ncbi:hypothetical protein CAPTEDRAFT_195278 [Capitella teleta]|uniref:BHLH domain-containing protein n=1 Tax=Capitella teleta TaxID=283909 RepID=R7VFJ0_CAPTE|nr:hypothetical protein CAPTEDRAFT_195278 [Capitella teleta]|eukprot:ELU17384.1 hypothetical protein CAPTEDRAFT_195278 [Capitella teleta]
MSPFREITDAHRSLDDLNLKSCRFEKKKRKRLHIPHEQLPVGVVTRRNARERSRIQAVNSEFENLRQKIPELCSGGSKSRRVSKERILQEAMNYIHELRTLLTRGATEGPPVYHAEINQDKWRVESMIKS